MGGVLLLKDGSVIEAGCIGAVGVVSIGQICFNTGMTGYQEVMTDPSYAGQIVTFSAPYIGNVGVNTIDTESIGKYLLKGVVVSNYSPHPSNWRASSDLSSWLASNGIGGLCGVDTVSLVHYIREHGAQMALLSTKENANIEELRAVLAEAVSYADMDWVKCVSTRKPYKWHEGRYNCVQGERPIVPPLVVVMDYGVKHNILRCLYSAGFDVLVLPHDASWEEIVSHKPSGIVLSNGPGDPKVLYQYISQQIESVLFASGVPVFGICLGMQLMALAMGGDTYPLRQGHRGINHPVQFDGRVAITSHNHGYGVSMDGVSGVHRSLFDGCLEGFEDDARGWFAVQYHPEASPGPEEGAEIFGRFYRRVMECNLRKTHADLG